MPALSLHQSYRHCLDITRNHYENFPVASLLLPRQLRKPVSVIYAFARMADDFADEGQISDEQRTYLLDQARQRLLQAAKGKPADEPVYIALADVLNKKPGLLDPLLDLLLAFNQDVHKRRYHDFGEVMSYCRYSANPVGRMLLILADAANTRNLAYSDAICSALQLINFLQDIQSDYTQRNRIYMPADELSKYKLEEAHLDGLHNTSLLTAFVNFQTQRIFKLLQAGAPLGLSLQGRMGLEIRMIILGGWKVLKKIHENQGDISISPRLSKRDWLWIFSRALSSRFTVYLNKLTQ